MGIMIDLRNPTVNFALEAVRQAVRLAKQIQVELGRIEQEQNVCILYACESGSRAWGFESQDSDFDVRFIYVQPTQQYLRVMPGRDVIEHRGDKVLDVSGWDLRKALQLLRSSNPPLPPSNSPNPFVGLYTTDPGYLAMFRMKADIFPRLGAPAIYVAQPYGGMDPSQMEGYLTYYYEYHFLYITGIEHVESKSIQGAAIIKLQFHPGMDMSQAMAEMPPKPSSASVRPSRNSASRPPLPLPRTVTVVSPPEMIATGGTKGWP